MENISQKITIELTKTTLILGVIVFALGYFIGNTLPVTGALIGVIPSGQTNVQVGQPSGQTAQAGPTSFDVPSFAKFEGKDSAKVNIIEFGDYQCPFCERFFSQTEPQITTDYVSSGKAKFYFLDFAFLGPDSLTLGDGAWCADEQGMYYAYHDYIYSNQQQENTGWATPDKLKTIAANIKSLDAQKFNSCLDSKKYESRVQQLTQMGQTAGVSGTPAFLIGNSDKGYTLVVGAQPYASIKPVIDQYLQ